MTDSALFEVVPVEVAPCARVGVSKTFRAFDPDQVLLIPPSLDDWLPADHLARFVAECVDEMLDLSAIYDDYTETRGFPPYDPRLMLRLLVYGYTTGVHSSRAIARRCVDDVAFRFLSAEQFPDHRSISKFRRRHLAAFTDLFVQSARIAAGMGMVRLGRVALDGTKLRAYASKHKAMSYSRLVEKEAEVAAEVARIEKLIAGMLSQAEATDIAEDKFYGVDGEPVDLPGELARRQVRLAKMRAAKADLEAEAADRARMNAQSRERARQQKIDNGRDPGDDDGSDGVVDEAAVAEAGARAADQAEPKPKAQRNFTDPDSRIMKNSDGGFMQAYNGQAVVDDTNQIIVAADVTDCASDSPSLTPMLDQAQANMGAAPEQVLADAGYCSEANLAASAEREREHGTEVLIAAGRLKHGQTQPVADAPTPVVADAETQPIAPEAPIQEVATLKEQMAWKLRTKDAKAAYARRKVIVEPVFGQIDTCQNGKRLALPASKWVNVGWL